MRREGFRAPHNMQVKPVFTQVGTGFFCVVTASCAGKLAGQAREAPEGSARGFSPDVDASTGAKTLQYTSLKSA